MKPITLGSLIAFLTIATCLLILKGSLWFTITGISLVYTYAYHIEKPAVSTYKPNKSVKKKKLATPHYVYVIQGPDRTYKIGYSANPADRMKTFEVKLPFQVKFVKIIECKDARKLESRLHEYFAQKRINGEWFRLSPSDLEWIKNTPYTEMMK